MLFNSYTFIFIFLPATLLGFHLIGNKGHKKLALVWLVSASLFFYGWWNPAYLSLLLFSTIFNYSTGIFLGGNSGKSSTKKIVLMLGIIVNLSMIGYFKYANFFIDNLNTFTSNNIILYEIILPLGISFFTFQQISYLVDAYYKDTKEYSFINYCLFVTFFPQLIAGPIVHHKEMLPQFIKDSVYKICSKNLAIGATIFALGLFKKVVLADGVSAYAIPIFDAAEAGIVITFFEAWVGALAYTFQLYFDFSGYSDMAIGIARMFGILLPLNFNSPYKATNISDFWRRWHITLSRFLRNYIYIPLGGNRKGEFRTYTNLMATFVICGLWHGAGWNFIIFGFMHGFYLVVFNLWTNFKFKFSSSKIITNSIISSLFGWLITFICVVFAWVLFRSESSSGAINLLQSMVGVNGIGLPVILENIFLNYDLFTFSGMFSNGFYSNNLFAIFWIFSLLLITVLLPNTQQIMRNHKPAFETHDEEIISSNYKYLEWEKTIYWAFFISIIMAISILSLSGESEFLYFQF
tara:strand:- start:3109 stop:4671 length:1563 start_codon:yes stop_codon:yes gene_type:complete